MAVDNPELPFAGGGRLPAVGDHHQGGTEFIADAVHQGHGFEAGFEIKIACRLVREYQAGFFDQGAYHCGPLLFAARDFLGITVELVDNAGFTAEFFKQPGFPAAEQAQGQADVFAQGQGREQIEKLENKTEVMAAVAGGLGFRTGFGVELVQP